MTIKVGDLVQIVKPLPCCGGVASLGQIFAVAEVNGDERGLRCTVCGHWTAHSVDARDARDNLWVPLSRLKRIPPLDELDDVKRDVEITA